MRYLLLFFSLSSVATVSAADVTGLSFGRSANIPKHNSSSVEFGIGHFTDQLNWAVARLNYKPASDLSLYVDLASIRISRLPLNATQFASFNGSSVGAGIVFGINDFLNSYDLAFKVSLHSLSGSFKHYLPASQPHANAKFIQQHTSAALVFSPIDPLLENGLSWFASGGVVKGAAHVRSSDESLSTEQQIHYKKLHGVSSGIGLVLPVAHGQIFVGFEVVGSNPLVSAAIRIDL